ncbi:MAG: RIP metalloprotease RseP [Candidatus Omnitrophica bacterium]|nr:RIP metalloprotease RseP [Candidatus Omnitrophota bacterium]MDD5080486.1 RIP metalloprotease RseP [Candidatus Omnitrophota bacterium]MDD5440746.1 RIP metalloprotease RseP [Candidatus Omnitrophota bacterium]
MLNILIFLLILSVLVVAHEFGHFIAARKMGVRVEKFSIGFGPVIFCRKGKETDFLVCAFPLGGYVKLEGDNYEELKGTEHEFLSKAPGIKALIVFAGPFFNLVLAFILFWIMAVFGIPRLGTTVSAVKEDYPAYSAGILEGDKILKVNDKEVEFWDDMTELIRKSGLPLSLTVQRGDTERTFELGLKGGNTLDEFGLKRNVPMVGIMADNSDVKIYREGFLRAVPVAFELVVEKTMLLLKGFAYMITGEVNFKDSVAGPLGIYYITAQAAKIGILAIINLMAILNISLFVVNLIPFPILDGGHLFLFLLEKIRGKRINEKTEVVLSRIGMVVLGTLIIFVSYNDFVKFGSKIWNSKSSGQVIEDIESGE